MVEAARLALQKAEADAAIRTNAIMEAKDNAIAEINKEKDDFEMRKANAESWLAKYEQSNPEKTDIPAMLEQAETHNKKYHLVCQYNEKVKQYDDIKAKADAMTGEISSLMDERSELITNSELPIAGLSFTDDGLELNGIPFVPGKISDSQLMEIAAKLVIASNPKVKVFRIARGESLGAKRLQTIIDIARKNGYQGFIENVVRGQEEMRIEEYSENE